MKAAKRQIKKRILVTGFEPFGGEPLNPTQMLVEALGRGEIAAPASVEVKTLLLPVVFGLGFAKLQMVLREFRPDIVLSFGQAGGRSAIEFERVAVNLIDGEQKDNAGVAFRETPIEAGGANALFSTLPIHELVDHLNANGVPAKISNSAGLFVCNEVFYRLQQACLRSVTRSGFIHVPYLEEQVREKEAANRPPSMSSDSMKKALELILARLA